MNSTEVPIRNPDKENPRFIGMVDAAIPTRMDAPAFVKLYAPDVMLIASYL